MVESKEDLILENVDKAELDFIPLPLNILESFGRNYTGKPLYMIMTGGATTLTLISTIPGASRYIHKIEIPYSHQAVADMIDYTAHKSVSYERVAKLLEYAKLQTTNPSDYEYVIVSAALTSDRYRKGENKAVIYHNGAYYDITLKKALEDVHIALKESDLLGALRVNEDVMLTLFTLIKLCPNFLDKEALGELQALIDYYLVVKEIQDA